MTERELRSAVSRSQRDGFHALFQQYQNYVYTIVWDKISGVGCREDAEECVSDVFREVFLHYEDIEEGTLQGYIGTVAKRRSIDYFRKLTMNERPVSLDDEDQPDIPSADLIEEQSDKNDLHRQLLETIWELGEPDSTIVLQKYYYDCDTKTSADNVHMNPLNVRVRLSRALKRLQKLLTDKGISM